MAIAVVSWMPLVHHYRPVTISIYHCVHNIYRDLYQIGAEEEGGVRVLLESATTVAVSFGRRRRAVLARIFSDLIYISGFPFYTITAWS